MTDLRADIKPHPESALIGDIEVLRYEFGESVIEHIRRLDERIDFLKNE